MTKLPKLNISYEIQKDANTLKINQYHKDILIGNLVL